jgi:hypothetical protein
LTDFLAQTGLLCKQREWEALLIQRCEAKSKADRQTGERDGAEALRQREVAEALGPKSGERGPGAPDAQGPEEHPAERSLIEAPAQRGSDSLTSKDGHVPCNRP